MRSNEKLPRDTSILGARIRQRRREIGLSQSALAKSVGISPSYLNLIEWNKRRIAGTLLRNIAEALNVGLDELDGVAERRLVEDLAEIAHLPPLAPLAVEVERTSELIGRFPGWSRALAALARAERESTARANTLSDRMSNDPFLGEAVHRMLTRIAAVRSAVEILSDYPDIDPDRRTRFTRMIREESGVLSEAGEALAAYLDKAEDEDRVLTPIDEVEAFFQGRDNRFEIIEDATAGLSRALADPRTMPRAEKARALIDETLDELIEETIDGCDEIRTVAARGRARRALTTYAVGAVLMPMEQFAERAADLRYDIEALAECFATDSGAVCRRLTALSPGPDRPRFGYFRANAAGTITEMLGLDGLAVPRYAPACPLWVLFRAQQSPEAVIRQRALFPSGARYVFVARAGHSGPTGFGRPRHYITDMVAMREEDARHTVYAPDPSSLVEEVGPSCRLCPRRSCIHRVDDPLAD